MTRKTIKVPIKIRTEVREDVLRERFRQDQKFGWTEEPKSILPNGTESARLSVLTEEVGEVARAINELTFSIGKADRERWEQNLEDELVQVAAVCVAWLEARRQKAAGAL